MTPRDALVCHFSDHDAELALRVLDAAGFVVERKVRAGEEEIREVWQAYLGHHPRAHLDSRRRRLIATRLRDGFAAADLVAAIHGNHRSPWHCGANQERKSYHDLGLILRNADTIERFASEGSPAERLARGRWEASAEERAYQASEPQVDPAETARRAQEALRRLGHHTQEVA